MLINNGVWVDGAEKGETQTLGRFAFEIAKDIRGKYQASFTRTLRL